MSNTIRPASKVTVVEEGTEFRGTLTSSCPIDVRGRIEGELKTPALTVSASGAVHGRTTVGEMRSLGEISGEFDADKIELAGRVRDNTVIRARSLDVKIASERGKLQIIFGECELSVGDEPRETDHVDEAAAAVAAMAPAPVMEAPAAPAAEMPVEMPAEPAPAVMSAEPAAAAPEAHEAEEEADDEGESMNASAGGKRKRRRKNGHEEPATGWSQPPSQPPPAN